MSIQCNTSYFKEQTFKTVQWALSNENHVMVSFALKVRSLNNLMIRIFFSGNISFCYSDFCENFLYLNIAALFIPRNELKISIRNKRLMISLLL